MKWITYNATITILPIYILMQGIYHGARSATIWIYYMCQNKHTRQKSLRKYMRCWRSRLARCIALWAAVIIEARPAMSKERKARMEFDTDSFDILIDNCCSHTLTNDIMTTLNHQSSLQSE